MRKHFFLPFVTALAFTAVLYQNGNAQNTSAYWSLAGNSNASSSSKLGNTTATSLRLITNNSTRIYISPSAGNVGIGTTSPVQKLDVNGNINVAKGYGLYMENRPVLRVDSALGSLFLGNGAGTKNTGPSNTAVGSYALASNTTGDVNVAIGRYSLYSNTTGFYNIAVGPSSLYLNTTGGFNVATGVNALYGNTTGRYNTATGFNALQFNTTGRDNTASGAYALYQNTEGENNVASGSYVMGSNKTGSNNVAAGNYALFKNTTGSYNVALGKFSFVSSMSGDGNVAIGADALDGTDGASNNTAVGYKAGYYYRHGWNNTFIGYAANSVTNDIYNSIAIGYATTVNAPNQVRIGNYYTQSIGGYTTWTNVSDGRVKRNVQENVPGLAFINKLKPVTYNLDLDAADKISGVAAAKDKDGKPLVQPLTQMDLAARQAKQKIVYTGFVAQDVEKAAKELKYDFSGVDAAKNEKDLYGLRYSDFVTPLVKAVQELSKENEELRSRFEKENGELRSRLEKLEAQLAGKQPVSTLLQSSKTAVGTASLQQNMPNPAMGSTRITYTIGEASKQAHLLLTDGAGKTVKTISLTTSGVVDVATTGFSSGVYNYSLVVDGKVVETKRMTVAH